jgi:hypothetical protein
LLSSDEIPSSVELLSAEFSASLEPSRLVSEVPLELPQADPTEAMKSTANVLDTFDFITNVVLN